MVDYLLEEVYREEKESMKIFSLWEYLDIYISKWALPANWGGCLLPQNENGRSQWIFAVEGKEPVKMLEEDYWFHDDHLLVMNKGKSRSWWKGLP